MANLDYPHGFVPYDHTGLSSAPIHWYEFTDAASIAQGDAVIVDDGDAGYVKIALADSPLLLGVAATPAVGGTPGKIAVYDSLDTIFEVQASGDTAQALVNTQCDIEGTTGIMEANENASVEDVLSIVGLHPNDEIGTNGRLLVKIIRSETAPIATAQT